MQIFTMCLTIIISILSVILGFMAIYFAYGVWTFTQNNGRKTEGRGWIGGDE